MDPITRSVYLLKIKAGITALAEEDKKVPYELMVEVFQIREEIDECVTEQDLHPLQMDIQQRFQDILEKIEERFSEEDYEGIPDLLTTAKYFEKILEEIDSKSCELQNS